MKPAMTIIQPMPLRSTFLARPKGWSSHVVVCEPSSSALPSPLPCLARVSRSRFIAYTTFCAIPYPHFKAALLAGKHKKYMRRSRSSWPVVGVSGFEVFDFLVLFGVARFGWDDGFQSKPKWIGLYRCGMAGIRLIWICLAWRGAVWLGRQVLIAPTRIGLYRCAVGGIRLIWMCLVWCGAVWLGRWVSIAPKWIGLAWFVSLRSGRDSLDSDLFGRGLPA